MSATAVAAVSNPGYTGSGALFPMAVTGCLYSTYWNASTGQPNIDPSTGRPYVFDSADPYPNSSSCYAGQSASWTGSTQYIQFQMAANADRCVAGGGSGGSGGTGVGYGTYLPPRIVN